MDYPLTLTLQQLEQEHPQYTEAKDCYNTLSLLMQGGYRLEKAARRFIHRRSGEPKEVYEARIKKLTYASPLADAISEHSTKISEGQLLVELPMLSSGEVIDAADWALFRESTNGKGRTEKALISKLLRDLLLYKKVFIHVDRKSVPFGFSPETIDEERRFGGTPRANLFAAPQVPAWDEAEDGTLNWVKFRTVEYRANPFGEADILIRWTFVDDQYIAIYEAVADSFDADGKVRSLKTPNTQLNAQPPTEVLLKKLTPHGFGRIPLIKVECDDDLWLGNQCYLKAKEHLVLSCQRYDLASFAYVQRTVKPTYRELDPGALLEDVTKLPPDFETGNYSVLRVDEFAFVEMHGHILPHLKAALSDIKNEIHSLCKLGGTVLTNGDKGAIAQSGASKLMDFQKQETFLKECGVLLTDAYQDVLQLVAIALAQAPEEVSVSGLNKFNLRQLSDLIAVITEDSIWSKLVPPVQKQVLSQLYDSLISNTTAQQKSDIEALLDSLLASAPVPASQS